MSVRIAEFADEHDAMAFMRMKGSDYTVCGGIHLMWAVRPKESHEVNLGSPFEPPERVTVRERDPDLEMLEEYE